MKIIIKVPIKTEDGLGEIIYEDKFDFSSEINEEKIYIVFANLGRKIRSRIAALKASLEN